MSRTYTYLRTAIEEATADPNPSALLDAWLARRSDHQIVGSYQDAGVSGLTPPEERLGFQALLSAVAQETGEVVLLLPAMHHLSRQPAVLREVQAHLAGSGVRILTPEGSPDEDPRERQLVDGVLSAIQEYRRSLRRRHASA